MHVRVNTCHGSISLLVWVTVAGAVFLNTAFSIGLLNNTAKSNKPAIIAEAPFAADQAAVRVVGARRDAEHEAGECDDARAGSTA
jgi:hypothetical protein